MNTQPIASGFAQMGARVKVREIPSRWTQGDRWWISPQDYSLDIQRDGKGEFFELRLALQKDADSKPGSIGDSACPPRITSRRVADWVIAP
jgi:hypothetical protein